jgi:hypothetical protein
VTWAHWHTISEKHASDAHVALHRATGSFRQAAEAETTALHQLDLGKTRTLGITAVSAVALWLKAGDSAKAEDLALKMLARSDLPLFASEQLQHLLKSIRAIVEMRTAAVVLPPSEVSVLVETRDAVTRRSLPFRGFHRTRKLLRDWLLGSPVPQQFAQMRGRPVPAGKASNKPTDLHLVISESRQQIHGVDADSI